MLLRHLNFDALSVSNLTLITKEKLHISLSVVFIVAW